jgi:hypothetical protein
VKGWGIPEDFTEAELEAWALREVKYKRGVVVGQAPEWGMTLARCVECGFLHLNVIRVSFSCRRCGRVQSLGDNPDPLPERVDEWLRLQKRRGRVVRFGASKGLGMIQACPFCHFVIEGSDGTLLFCPVCRKGVLGGRLREVPPLWARLRAWGWWRIWGDMSHLRDPE